MYEFSSNLLGETRQPAGFGRSPISIGVEPKYTQQRTTSEIAADRPNALVHIATKTGLVSGAAQRLALLQYVANLAYSPQEETRVVHTNTSRDLTRGKSR